MSALDEQLTRLLDRYGAADFTVEDLYDDDPVLRAADGTLVDTWREGYPYDERLDRDEYDMTKRLLQIELLKLQKWMRATGSRALILYEGRDARLPAAGEIVLFDRSWYTRAGVEKVMGFCTDEEYALFLRQAPDLERMLTDAGFALTKFWFSVSPSEQRTRFLIRQIDPVRQWKLSPIDLASLDLWDEYTAAKETMFFHTDTPFAPWTVVKSNDKKRARLESMRVVLAQHDYDGKDEELVGRPDPLIVGHAADIFEQGENQHPVRLRPESDVG